MVSDHRKFSLSIWGLGLGYFLFYAPYSGMIKAITWGVLPGATGPVPGFELLPLSVAATFVGMLGFITIAGWWKHAGHRTVWGFQVPVPGRSTFLSGLCTATIIGTTTLAFSFKGNSIIFVLVLLRAGVLIIAPLVDALLKRNVRWFSWTAMWVSLAALMVTLGDAEGYHLTALAALNVAAYLLAYFFRFRWMTRLAKSDDWKATRRYFVEEQIVATPALLLVLGLFGLIGSGEMTLGLRNGFTTFPFTEMAVPALGVGLLYAALCVCTTLIFLDRRENTFCIPMHCGSSMLSGVAASYVLGLFTPLAAISAAQLWGAGLIIIALLFLSPLHHFELYAGKLRRWLAGDRRRLQRAVTGTAIDVRPSVFLFVCGRNTIRSPLAQAICQHEITRRLGVSLRDLAQSRVRVMSAGVSAKTGAPAAPGVEQALRQLALPVLWHESRMLTAAMVEEADVIYCLTRAHREAVINLVPSAAVKTLCLDPSRDVEEPGSLEATALLGLAQRLQHLVRQRLDEFGMSAGPSAPIH